MNEDDDVYYCKQCGWHGQSNELYVCAHEYYEDYPPFFCPKCLADEYSLDETFNPEFRDKLKFFYRRICFYAIRRRMRIFNITFKEIIQDFFKYYIKKQFRRFVKTIKEVK